MGSPRRSWLVIVLAACGPAVGTDTAETGTTASTGVAETSVGPTSAATISSTTSDDTTTTTTSTSSGSGEPDSTTEPPPPDVAQCPALSCDGNNYACTNGEDDDLDGLVDLLDLDCISVCDDDEDAFLANTPPGNFDCRWDCVFDGNTGQGDDGCMTNLRCDEEDPGGPIGCDAYGMGPPNPECEAWPPPQSDECIAFCEPFVLPGCDCFGCCTLATDDGPISFFLDGSPDCGSDNRTGCQPCTQQIEICGNACTPEACEICFGETAPPEGCRTNECENGSPCTAQTDCACDEMCILGCCLPLPPG